MPKHIGDHEFKPNSIPGDTADPENYRQPVAVFEFDEWIAALMLKEPLNRWCCSNDGIHADELLFWSKGIAKLHAIPWEGLAYFDQLTLEELRLLKDSDGRIQEHLYSQ